MIENLAPDIFRQRLLIESFYTIDISKKTLEKYLLDVAEYLSLRTYGKPIISLRLLRAWVKRKMQDTMPLFRFLTLASQPTFGAMLSFSRL